MVVHPPKALFFIVPWFLFCAGISDVQGEIYRWTDADGRVQFSDKPPNEGGNRAERLTARYQNKIPFSFEILPIGYSMRTDTRVKVEVAVSKIHEILSQRLGVHFRSDPKFDIRIFSDRDSYSNYGNGAPLGGLASGYYSPLTNEAVTWRQQSFQQLLQVITHEANHALMRHQFGIVIPPWLNEGLSEYFEQMEVFGQAIVIQPNRRWDDTVRTQVRSRSIKPLREYMALSQLDWQIHNSRANQSYAQAWSFVYFMMSTPWGTKLLGEVLTSLDRADAKDFSAADIIDTKFNGGLAALETRWRAWALGPKKAHHY